MSAVSAMDLLQRGVDQAAAAAWNGSGEFWVTTDLHRANWFARSHPGSPPAARFEFDLTQGSLVAILNLFPSGAVQHGTSDYELLPVSYALLNIAMINRQVVLLP